MFALIGALPWLAELPDAPRYADQSRPHLEARLLTITGATNSHDIHSFIEVPGTVLTEGRLLYPRYFYRGVGMSSANAWPAYAIRDYPRTGFMLLNGSFSDALFPARDAQPFPHGVDAIVLGCQRDGYLEVRLIAFPGSNVTYLSAPLDQPCNLP